MRKTLQTAGRHAGTLTCNRLPGTPEDCTCRVKAETRLGTSTGADLIVECESQPFYPHRD
jgi:hypothetical protein